MEFAIKYQNPYQNCKYTLSSMRLKLKKETALEFSKAKSLAAICRVLKFDDLIAEAEKHESEALYDDMCPYIPENDDLIGDEEEEEVLR